MIYDGLDAIARYRGLYRGLDVLIDWLEHNDPADLPTGSTEIEGMRVFANVMETSTRPATEAQFEAHRKYMDVQIDLDGAEAFKTLPATPDWSDEAEDDILLAPEDAASPLDGTLGHGRFVLFALGEPHMPTLTLPGTDPAPVRKVCFKITGDEFWNEL